MAVRENIQSRNIFFILSHSVSRLLRVEVSVQGCECGGSASHEFVGKFCLISALLCVDLVCKCEGNRAVVVTRCIKT